MTKKITVGKKDYFTCLQEIKERIRKSQYEALKAVNKELITLYWDIGRIIIEKQILPQIFLGKAKKLNESRWRERLVKSFTDMKVPMGRLESVAWRLRRNYLIIFPLIFISWLVKIQSFPVPAQTLDKFFLNARIWLIPGEIVFYFFLVSVILAIVLSFYLPIRSRHSDLP